MMGTLARGAWDAGGQHPASGLPDTTWPTCAGRGGSPAELQAGSVMCASPSGAHASGKAQALWDSGSPGTQEGLTPSSNPHRVREASTHGPSPVSTQGLALLHL